MSRFLAWLIPNSDCVILSPLTDGRSQLKLHHRLPTEGAGGFRTARWSLVLPGPQSQAPDSQAAPLQADEAIHALCEALIAWGQLGL
jgi:hypothetical protein